MCRSLANVSLIVISCLALTACQPGMGNKTWLGAGAGAAAGALIGGGAKGGRGAMIGAGAGAVAGGLVGHAWQKYLDQQQAELNSQLSKDNVTIERVGDELRLSFKADDMFDSGSQSLQPRAAKEIQNVAAVLNNYPESIIVVRGHTDSVGSQASNQQLSEKRAGTVRDLLVAKEVSTDRIMTIGYGEDVPLASNDTESGRKINRRTEIFIMNTETSPSRS
jgi:outer membrane protein OmpA-like peptidoglycan-associated protein